MWFIFHDWKYWRCKLHLWQYSVYTRKIFKYCFGKTCAFRNISKWLFNKTTNANPDKCHFLSSLDMNTNNTFDIDHKLNFLDHVTNLWEKNKWKKCHSESLPIYGFKSKNVNPFVPIAWFLYPLRKRKGALGAKWLVMKAILRKPF